MVRNMIEDLDTTYKKAIACLFETGDGLTEKDFAGGIDTVEGEQFAIVIDVSRITM